MGALWCVPRSGYNWFDTGRQHIDSNRTSDAYSLQLQTDQYSCCS